MYAREQRLSVRHITAEHYFLQPCMDAAYEAHLRRAIEMATRRPRWRLSLQLHKIIGMP